MITGEATPDYLFHPAAAKLCKQITPDARFIVLMRNPVDRAFSHWKQSQRFAFDPLPFDEAIAMEEARLAGEEDKLISNRWYYSYRHQLYSYKARGRYAEQIERWLEHFPIESFMFIQSEEMFANGSRTVAEVETFLSLPQTGRTLEAKFKGLHGEITQGVRETLIDYFAPYNEYLYTLINRRFNW